MKEGKIMKSIITPILSVIMLVSCIAFGLPERRSAEASTNTEILTMGEFDGFYQEEFAIAGNHVAPFDGLDRHYNSWRQFNGANGAAVITNDAGNSADTFNRVLKFKKGTIGDNMWSSAVGFIKPGLNADIPTVEVSFDLKVTDWELLTEKERDRWIEIYFSVVDGGLQKSEVFKITDDMWNAAPVSNGNMTGYKRMTHTFNLQRFDYPNIELFAFNGAFAEFYFDNFSISQNGSECMPYGDFDTMSAAHPLRPSTEAAGESYGQMWWGQNKAAAQIKHEAGDAYLYFQKNAAPLHGDGWNDNSDIVTIGFPGILSGKLSAGKYVLGADINFANTEGGYVGGGSFILWIEGNGVAIPVHLLNKVLPDSTNKPGWKRFDTIIDITEVQAANIFHLTINYDAKDANDYVTIDNLSLGTPTAPTVSVTSDNVSVDMANPVLELGITVSGYPTPVTVITCNKTVGFTRDGKTVTFTEAGEYVFTITAVYEGLGSESKTITVSVTSAPIITATTQGNADLANGGTYTLDYSVSGSPTPVTTVTCDKENGFTKNGNIVTFTKTGTYVFTVEAESAAGKDAKTITVIVADTRSAPVITATESGTVDLKKNTTYDLVYSVSGSPDANVTITCDKNTGFTRDGNKITFSEKGTYVFTVTAENGVGTDTKTITVTVTKSGGGCSGAGFIGGGVSGIGGIGALMLGLGGITLIKRKSRSVPNS